jgi:SAM-dependent methyltransferase
MGVVLASALAIALQAEPRRTPDVPYEPTPGVVVQRMLELAAVGPRDVVYDLGCGDGRIVIAAVRDRRARRGVCIDIDPERIRESIANAQRARVANRIQFRTQDLFEADLRDATVVTLFLWPEVNLRLRPKLLAELAPGARVVSHMHDMGDWTPDAQETVHATGGPREVYLWRVPARPLRVPGPARELPCLHCPASVTPGRRPGGPLSPAASCPAAPADPAAP